MITSIQLSSIIILSLCWCTLPLCAFYIHKLRVISSAARVVARKYKLTLCYLAAISVSCYLLHPISVILFYFANGSQISTLSHTVNDISLFMVVYFSLGRYVCYIKVQHRKVKYESLTHKTTQKTGVIFTCILTN